MYSSPTGGAQCSSYAGCPNDRDAVRDGAEAVGGTVDTVFDRDYSARPPGERNGYVFHQADNLAIESVLSRALGLWFGYPAEFRQFMVDSMRAGYSWARPGHDYLDIYEYIRHQ